MRNSDLITISTNPFAVERGGTSYTVIGEAFVRIDGTKKRQWRPAVVWPACESIDALIDLARSPHFDFNEPEYSDPSKAVLNNLTAALAG
jgi:hypothetical protein